MKNLTTAYLTLLALTLVFAGCSTTSKLPEGEILYTGINSINYVDQGDKYRKGDAKYAGGVIVSIADAVDKISDAFIIFKQINHKYYPSVVINQNLPVT